MSLVLVVDDDAVFREIVREMLIQDGHEVVSAEDGDAALRVVDELRPDLAVVDMLMPNRDGIETIGGLKRRWPGVKTIAVSAGSVRLEADSLLRAAKVLGADATMEKPVQRSQFLDTVHRLLG
ncbi:MAG: response regulator [Caulobacterales bacterium]